MHTPAEIKAHFQSLMDPEALDPFWDRLIDGAVPEGSFDRELLEHLWLTEHPKGEALIRCARKMAWDNRDLQEIYLTALNLSELIL